MSEVLRLGRQQDRRLRAGHLWVYSNEVDSAATPLKGFQPGQPVQIEDAKGKWLGLGYVNPNSLICARLVSRDRGVALDESLLTHRIKVALGLRDRLYSAPFYRLLFGETDGVPGVVVDRYGDVLAVQITTAGMEVQRDALISALVKLLQPRGIVVRNDTAVRELEGLERYTELAYQPMLEILRFLRAKGFKTFIVSGGGVEFMRPMTEAQAVPLLMTENAIFLKAISAAIAA